MSHLFLKHYNNTLLTISQTLSTEDTLSSTDLKLYYDGLGICNYWNEFNVWSPWELFVEPQEAAPVAEGERPRGATGMLVLVSASADQPVG